MPPEMGTKGGVASEGGTGAAVAQVAAKISVRTAK
jgi:hypothetical protein